MTPPSFDQLVTFIYTRDLDESVYFYESILGLPLALDQGSCRIYRVGQAGYLGVCKKASISIPREGVIATLVSDDVDGWYEHLKAKGIVFEKAPALNEEFNVYNCFFRDPAGYLIEIQRFLDPSWPKPGR
jgi:catechol 2,3-dioxygenase-like lactoylglutathione lyase family enzyme